MQHSIIRAKWSETDYLVLLLGIDRDSVISAFFRFIPMFWKNVCQCIQ